MNYKELKCQSQSQTSSHHLKMQVIASNEKYSPKEVQKLEITRLEEEKKKNKERKL